MEESQSLPGFRQPLTYTGEGKGGPCPEEEVGLLRRPPSSLILILSICYCIYFVSVYIVNSKPINCSVKTVIIAVFIVLIILQFLDLY